MKHNTSKELRKGVWITFAVFTFSIASGSFLMLWGKTLTGIMSYSIAAVWGLMMILIVIKLQSLLTREMLAKIHSRDLKEFCDCKDCDENTNTTSD